MTYPLAPEITCMIIKELSGMLLWPDHVAAPSEQGEQPLRRSGPAEWRRRNAVLLQLATIDKHWSASALSVLYSELCIVWTPWRGDSLSRVLLHRPGLALVVTRVEM